MNPTDHLIANMRKLPEVKWDRMTGHPNTRGKAYGWIARPDGRYDFLVLEWQTIGTLPMMGFTTSSATMSAEFNRRLFGDGSPHEPCVRIADSPLAEAEGRRR